MHFFEKHETLVERPLKQQQVLPSFSNKVSERANGGRGARHARARRFPARCRCFPATTETRSSLPRVICAKRSPDAARGTVVPASAPLTMSARSPSTPASFVFGDGARVAGRHDDGHVSGARTKTDEDGDFELESFPLTSLALGPWHARHVSTRLYFPSGRFVFVVTRRRRAEKASAFERTAELVTRHVARRLHVDVPMSPFDPDARGGPRVQSSERAKRARGDRGPNGGFGHRSAVPSPNVSAFAPFETFETFAPGATASVAGSVTGTSGVAFAEGSRETRTASLKRNHTTSRRSKHSPVSRCRDRVTTYAIDHDDVVGLNYVNPLCADGRLAMEARRVVKRAHATLDDAVASFATDTVRDTRGAPPGKKNASNATPTVTPLGHVFDRRRGDGGSAPPASVARARGGFRERLKRRRRASARDSTPTRGFPKTLPKTLPTSSPGDERRAVAARAPRVARTRRAAVRARRAERGVGVWVEPESSLDASPDATSTKSHRCGDTTDDTCGTNDAFCGDRTVFRDQTVFLCVDDPRVSAALRDVVTAERRLLALAEDGIPVWALVMASCGVYYRPWLRTASRLAFVLLALWSATAGARDVFRFCANAVAKTENANGVGTSSPAIAAVSSASANTLFLSSLAWTGGARLGFVDARAVRALTAALGAGARALTRVFAFAGYVVGRIVAHRLSLAIAIRRAWRSLPRMWADAHGFVVASETETFRRDRKMTEKTFDRRDFRAETFASPRRRKPETPARGAPTRRADDDK